MTRVCRTCMQIGDCSCECCKLK